MSNKKEDKEIIENNQELRKSVFAKRMAKETEKPKKSKVDAVKDLAPFVERFGQVKIDGWKEQFYGRELIALKEGSNMAVLRPPTADDIGEYMMAIATNGMSKAVAMIIDTLWLEGDYELIENEDKFISVFMQVSNILEGKKADFFRF